MTKKYALLNELVTRCRDQQISIALPELKEDERTKAALDWLSQAGVILHVYSTESLSKRGMTVVSMREHLPEEYRHESTLLQAGRLLQQGTVRSALAGARHTTAEVIRAAISTVGVAPGLKTVSGCFILQGPRRMLYADCGVVIEPTPIQLQDIAEASLDTWRRLFPHEAPVVGFLSFSTKGSAKHPKAEFMRAGAEEFRRRHPDVATEGELQFDAAWDPEIGMRKGIDPQNAGKTNIFIFPDLNAGNIAYKMSERVGQCEAYGPILQGLRKVYSDLSRGADALDIAASILINHLRSNAETN